MGEVYNIGQISLPANYYQGTNSSDKCDTGSYSFDSFFTKNLIYFELIPSSYVLYKIWDLI